MADNLRLMIVAAHPDDESLGFGGVLAKYAAQGVETYLITATRGEHGWWGDAKDYPGPGELGRIREAELLAAAQALGLRDVLFLDYIDGELDRASPAEAVAKIVGHLRRIRPHIVLTFDPPGAYGHPDHIAICQFTTAAVVCAADPSYADSSAGPHRVAKLYYRVGTQGFYAAYQSVFGDITMHIDGVDRRSTPWPEWAITTRIDTADQWPVVWKAVTCHRSQLPGYSRLEHLPEAHHRNLWGTQDYYRAYSTVNGGRAVERDLFEGLRS
ncbi:MAG TPA: PIG-L family deacetylase [Anaerolineae bacterium]